MSGFKRTVFDLPATTHASLQALAELESRSMKAVVTRLIDAEAKAKARQIKKLKR